MRKLASIKRISAIHPIDGKDRIALAIVDGWQVIVQKSDYNEGDLCVFCEIDSVLPDKPEFEFLRPKNFRIKTMKFGNTLSQGICFPLSILPPKKHGEYKEEEDVTEIIGVTQYEPTMDKEPQQTSKKKYPKFLMRFKLIRRILLGKKEKKGSFPTQYISKTDETRIQNIPHIVEDKNEWIATEKIDGCLTGETLITTDVGQIKISQIVNNKMNVSVMSFNEEANCCEFKPIVDWHKIADNRPHYRICVNHKGHGNKDKFIECTDNHKFLTDSGWREAKDLTTGDKLKHYSKVYPSETEEIIVGCLLGDASLNSNSETGNYRTINICQSESQSEYFDYKKKLFGSLFIEQRDAISGYGSVVHRGSLRSNLHVFNILEKICPGKGKKHITKEWCDSVTPISLAFWFMDDGTLRNRDDESLQCRSSICTQRYSLEENKLLSEMLMSKFGIEAEIGDKDVYKGYQLNLGVESTNKLCSLIAPYVCKSMKYKLPKKYENMPCVFENFSLDYCDSVSNTEIKSIELVQSNCKYVFDLEVADNHNYFAKNILVHNCSGSFLLVRHKSMFPFMRDKFEYVVCSRNLRLSSKDNSSYWKVSDRYNIESALRNMIGDRDWIAIQGECIAPNAQGNKYKVDEPDLYVFNLIYPTGRVGSLVAKSIIENHGMKFVPIVDEHYVLPDTVNEVLDYAHGQSMIGDTIREGIVFRSINGEKSFKAVDPLFLMKYNE